MTIDIFNGWSVSLIPLSQTLELLDSRFAEAKSCQIQISSSLSLQIHSDSKPSNGKIEDLQKGLIIVYDGLERVGEGTGFGVPVVKYVNETYFPGLSKVYTFQKQDNTTIVKIYAMNTVRRKELGKIYIRNRVINGVHRLIADAFQKTKHLRPLFLTILSQRLGLHGNFVKAEAIGQIIITFHVSHRGLVKVKADFSLIKKRKLQKIFLLNEQGSTFFRKYHDSNGTVLFDNKLGTWERVDAEWAMVSAPKNNVSFHLWKIKGSTLRRGREFLKGHLDWIGLDYEITPDTTEFEYEIEILGG
jgi:hypothetical protein